MRNLFPTSSPMSHSSATKQISCLFSKKKAPGSACLMHAYPDALMPATGSGWIIASISIKILSPLIMQVSPKMFLSGVKSY
jgi:hypothetical protein